MIRNIQNLSFLSRLVIAVSLLLFTATGCKKSSDTVAATEATKTDQAMRGPSYPLIIGKNNSTSGAWTMKLVKLVSNGAGGYTYTKVGYVGTSHYPNETPFWTVAKGCGEVTIPGIVTDDWAGLRLETINGNYIACPSVTFRNKVFTGISIPANSSQTLYY